MIEIHFVDGGELVSQGLKDFGYFDAETFICKTCGLELDVANDYDYIGTQEEYEALKQTPWQPKHGRPRRLYPQCFGKL